MAAFGCQYICHGKWQTAINRNARTDISLRVDVVYEYTFAINLMVHGGGGGLWCITKKCQRYFLGDDVMGMCVR